MPDTEEAAAAASKAKRDRVFLVVVDDSAEQAVALRYACLRARKGGGRVALLRVLEPVELVEWAGVGVMMQEERRAEAERLLAGLASHVSEITGGMPMLIIREGEAREELLSLIDEDPLRELIEHFGLPIQPMGVFYLHIKLPLKTKPKQPYSC